MMTFDVSELSRAIKSLRGLGKETRLYFRADGCSLEGESWTDYAAYRNLRVTGDIVDFHVPDGLADMVDKLTAGEVQIDVDGDAVKLRQGKVKAKYLLPVKEPPRMMDVRAEQTATLPAQVVARVLGAVLYARELKGEQLALQSVRLTLSGGRLEATSGTGFRAARASCATDTPETLDLFIHADKAERICNMIGKEDDALCITAGCGLARFAMALWDYRTGLTATSAPDFSRIYQELERADMSEYDRAALAASIGRAELAVDMNRTVRVDFGPECLMIAASSANGAFEDDVEAAATSLAESVRRCFNVRYLADAIKHTRADVVRVAVRPDSRSCPIGVYAEDDGLKYEALVGVVRMEAQA